MSFVVTLEDYRPSPRYDSLPWTEARIYEGTASTDTVGTLIDTVAFGTVDADPTDPAYRNFTTQLATAADLWYWIVFADVDGDTSLPTLSVQNTASAGRPVYATTAELARLLRVQESQRHDSLRRVLEAAAAEIDSEIGTADISGASLPYSNPPALASEVNLERAVEHWQQMQSPFGIIGMGDIGATYTARDSWDRHAHKLAVLKGQYGLA